MKLNQLEYFCAVCRYHSITRAAEELYVTQPTISVAIRELENELKLRLFHHEKNRISLTKEGEAFYRRAEALLKETRAVVTEFSSLGEQEMPIRIGIPPLMFSGEDGTFGSAFRIWFREGLQYGPGGETRLCTRQHGFLQH